MKRREFVAKTVAGSAAAALGVRSAFAHMAADEPTGDSAPGKKPGTVAGGIQRHRQLGRTGLWVSDIGLGTGRLQHPTVAIRAIELGVNYFDTAPDYGEAESILGRALKATKVDRSSVVITSKMCEKGPYPSHLGRTPDNPASVDNIVRCCEESLKRLQTDYLDVYMVHALGEHANDKRLDSEDLPAALDKLKKQGKIRFGGASSHGANNTTALLQQAIDGGLTDVLMPACNYLKELRGTSKSEFDQVLANAKKKNLGVIAMKTVPREKESQELTDLRDKVGADASYSHLCFAWALAQAPVAGLVKSMTNVKQVDEYVQSSGVKLASAHVNVLEAYAAALSDNYCRIGCGDCLASCPAEVPVPDLLRFNEYFVNYGLEKHAMGRYADLDGHRAVAACTTCDAPCERSCTYDLPVKSMLATADHNLHFDPYVRHA